jgi:hypothetical protein
MVAVKGMLSTTPEANALPHSFMADKVAHVSSSCEVKKRPSKSKGIP